MSVADEEGDGVLKEGGGSSGRDEGKGSKMREGDGMRDDDSEGHEV